ncbi:hypothetical protein HQ560_19430 [bacterium]|nr:hypothetical protein [bacterium]
MRIFYVRASDNGNYGIRAALTAAGSPATRLDVALYRGPRVPLLPLNYPADERGLTDLNGYGVVILAGVDPAVLSPADALAFVAYVERGGGLLLVGGSHSFANAEGTYLPLAPILPVRILRGLDVQVNAAPHAKPHPISRGLPEPLGYVSKVHDLSVKDGAEVVMTASDFPLVVAGEYEYGRVVVLASYPECHESEYGWFFTGDALDDFLRNTLDWLTKTHRNAVIESFSLTKRVLAPGEEAFGTVLLRTPEPATVRLTTTLTRADGSEVVRNESLLRVPESLETLVSVRPPNAKGFTGLHYLAVVVTDEDGREAARRDVAIEVAPPERVEFEIEHGRRLLPTGAPITVRVRAIRTSRAAAGSTHLRVALIGERDAVLVEANGCPTNWKGSRSEDLEMVLPPPPLRPGAYRLRAELRVSDRVIDTAEEPVHILPGNWGERLFPLIAEGAHGLDRESVDTGLAALQACGVNTLSFPGPVVQAWGERPHAEAMLGYAEEKAVLAGLTLAHHRRALLPGMNPAVPLTPCPLSQSFPAALEAHAKPILDAALRTPRLLFHEIAPRASVRPSQHCGCEACQAAFPRAYGQDLPTAPLDELSTAAHRNLCSFVASTWQHAYERLLAQRPPGQGPRLSLPFGANGFLRSARGEPYCDVATWSRACDTVEVEAERDLRLWQLSLSGHRTLSAALGKAFGAIVDLAEGSLAPAEAAWTAIAHGAAHLRVAENARFLFWHRQAPIGAALGDTFRRVGRISSLLARAERPKSRLALLMPSTQVVDGDADHMLSTYSMLYRAFGDVDVLHQRLLDDHLANHAALAILGVRVLPRRTVRAVVRFVERGGVLLADAGELTDETGAPVVWPDGFFGTAETPVFEDVACRRRAYGSGRTVCFSAHFVPTFERASSADDALSVALLAHILADELRQRGIRPHAQSTHPDVEVALLGCGGSQLLIAVNHSDAEQTAQAVIESDAIVALDLLAGTEQPFDGTLQITLPPHDGTAWLLAPERPFGVRIAPQDAPKKQLGFRVEALTDSGAPAHGAWPIRVKALDARGRERKDVGGDLVALNGALSFYVPLAVNEPAGSWTVTACDTITHRLSRATLPVPSAPSLSHGPASHESVE